MAGSQFTSVTANIRDRVVRSDTCGIHREDGCTAGRGFSSEIDASRGQMGTQIGLLVFSPTT